MTGTGDPLRDTISANTTAPELADLAHLVADYKAKLDLLEDEKKRVQGDYDAAQAALFDALENAGIRQIRTQRGLFSMNDLAWASIEDVEKAKVWADLHHPELITLNLQRLSKYVRDFLKGADDAAITELPEGVTFKTSRKITWKRS